MNDQIKTINQGYRTFSYLLRDLLLCLLSPLPLSRDLLRSLFFPPLLISTLTLKYCRFNTRRLRTGRNIRHSRMKVCKLFSKSDKNHRRSRDC